MKSINEELLVEIYSKRTINRTLEMYIDDSVKLSLLVVLDRKSVLAVTCEHARVTVHCNIILYLLNMQSGNKALLDDPEVYQCLEQALTQTNFASLPA